jgi:methyl-accepting chemotaxis protein
MLLFIVSAAALVFFSTMRIIRQNFKKGAYAEIMEMNDSNAKKFASVFQTSLETDFDKIRSFKQIIEENSTLSYTERRVLYDKVLTTMAEGNPNYTAIWDSWELRFTDANWDLPYGRVSRSFYYDAHNKVSLKLDSLDLEGDNYESLYYLYKLVPEEAITDPYYYSYTGKKIDEVLESSILVPLNVNKQFAGLVGIDIKLQNFQNFIDSINAEHSFDIMFFSFNGDIIAHPDKALIGKNIVVADTFLTQRFNILDHIQSGKSSNYTLKTDQGKDSIYFSLNSFKIGNTNTPWAVLIAAPLNQIDAQFVGIFSVFKDAIFVGLIVLIIVVFVFALSLTFPIQKTRNILNKLALGDVHKIDTLAVKSHDELGQMAESVNKVVEGLNSVTQFAENIGEGNYDYEFERLSDDDALGHAVIEMRNSLDKAREEELKRKEEAQQLEWASQGMNIFNRVLRVDNRNLEHLSYEIIKTLTHYLNAHMGGIYLKTDRAEVEYEMISFIGFSKEKYDKKFILPEDGVVGQCILEKETIYINDVPAHFDTIGSGLGKAVPKSILVVPLMSNRVLVGMLEIESLKMIQKYQVDFVERIAETIASTVSTVKTNVRTAQLLDTAQKQAEELEQQEEEMRQNMEEMQATQEEASKNKNELEATIEGFNSIMPVMEYDTQGKIIDVNDNYLKIYKAQKSKLIGKQHKADLFMNEVEQIKHKEFWDNLAKGIVSESLEYVKSGKDDFWLLEKFVPIKDQYGLVEKVLCIGIDITDQKKTESKIQQIQEGIIKTKEGADTKKAFKPKIDLNQHLEIVDLTYLKMVYKKDAAKIYNILKLYYDTLSVQVAEVESVAMSKDFVTLKTRVGNLKTKMSYLGLKVVYEKLREIEKLLAEQKNLIEIPEMVKGIKKHWSLAHDELKMLLKLPA